MINIIRRRVWPTILACIFAFLITITSIPPLAHAAGMVKDYIFLIDVSGSMVGIGDGRGNNVFPCLKTATKEFINKKIPAGANLQIITFGERVFGNRKFILNSSGQAKAIEYIDDLQATGKKTDLYGTTNDALDIADMSHDKPLMIFIFTDGKDNVHRVSAARVLSRYKLVKSHNPNLFVLCQYFTFKGAASSSPFPDEIPTTRLNRDDGNFLEHLRASLARLDARINEGLIKVRAEQKKLRRQKELLQKKESSIHKQESSIQKKNKLLQRQQSSLQKKQESLRKQRAALQGLKATLAEADRLLARARTIDDFKAAKTRYESALTADEHNSRATLGIKECNRAIDRLTPFYLKKINWLYALVLLALLFILNRLMYLGIIPNPADMLKAKPITCKVQYKIQDIDKLGKASIKGKKRTIIYIGKTSGAIMIPEDAVVDRHLKIFRYGREVFLSPEKGRVLDYNKQPLPLKGTMLTRSPQTFFLSPKNKDNAADIEISVSIV